jgi:hypothetical protein
MAEFHAQVHWQWRCGKREFLSDATTVLVFMVLIN